MLYVLRKPSQNANGSGALLILQETLLLEYFPVVLSKTKPKKSKADSKLMAHEKSSVLYKLQSYMKTKRKNLSSHMKFLERLVSLVATQPHSFLKRV